MNKATNYRPGSRAMQVYKAVNVSQGGRQQIFRSWPQEHTSVWGGSKTGFARAKKPSRGVAGRGHVWG